MRPIFLPTAAGVLLANTSVHAQTENNQDIEALRQTLAIQQAALDAQQKQLQALETARLGAQDAARWTVSYNRPALTTADGRSSLSLRAVVQADYAHYAQTTPAHWPPIFGAVQ